MPKHAHRVTGPLGPWSDSRETEWSGMSQQRPTCRCSSLEFPPDDLARTATVVGHGKDEAALVEERGEGVEDGVARAPSRDDADRASRACPAFRGVCVRMRCTGVFLGRCHSLVCAWVLLLGLHDRGTANKRRSRGSQGKGVECTLGL